MHEQSHEKQAARDLAEESRQQEWDQPSFAAELFEGRFRWDMIHPFPEQDEEDKRIGDEYIAAIREVLDRYIDPDEVDRRGEIPPEAIQALKDAGAFALKIPKEYGGLEMSQTNYNRVLEFIGSYCASTQVWISSHQSIGAPQPILLFGTLEQKRQWLPRLAKGEISAFALTEPGVGSDPARMETTATPSEDGAYYLLNGEKLWCTNGPVADILVVMAVTPPKIVNGREKKQITAFIVESNMPGFEIVHVCSFMGIRGIRNGLLRFNNVKVPAENIIGKPGDGLKIALVTLNTGRLGLPAVSTGGAKVATWHAKNWANERVQWGAPVGRHEAVAKMLGEMAADTFAMESICLLACQLVDRGQADIRLEAAMAKYFCTETCWRIADDFIQIRGGRGYETAESLAARGETPVAAERGLRDARIARIVEGTSEIMRLFIAREAMDTHVSRIMPIIKSKGAQRIKAMLAATRFYATWYPRQWTIGPGISHVKRLGNGNRTHLNFIARASKRLARTMFHVMARYQQKLEKEQIILGCFVDIGVDLFTMAACLARAEKMLERNPNDRSVELLADLFCQRARRRITANFSLIHANHEAYNRTASALLDGKLDWLCEGAYTDLPPAARVNEHHAETERVAK